MKSKVLLIVLLVLFMFIQAFANEKVVMERTEFLPKFEPTKPNMKVLEENLNKTGQLAEVLEKGNDELSEAIRQYKEDKNPQVKARIYALLGELANQTVEQIDSITANKDQIKDGVKGILHKIQRSQVSLTEKTNSFDEYTASLVEDADKVKAQLSEMAKELKKNPDNNELRRAFRLKLFSLKTLSKRYDTAKKHKLLYKKFEDQIGQVYMFFEHLDGNTDQMIANLQAQKQILIENVQLLMSSATLETILIDESQNSLSANSFIKQFANLSNSLDKINAATSAIIELNDFQFNFADIEKNLFDLEGIDLGDGKKTLDSYIDHFSKN